MPDTMNVPSWIAIITIAFVWLIFAFVGLVLRNRDGAGQASPKTASGQKSEEDWTKRLKLKRLGQFLEWWKDLIDPADTSSEATERRTQKTRRIALILALTGSGWVTLLCLSRGWLFRSKIEAILCAFAVLTVGGILYQTAFRRGMMAKFVPITLVFLSVAWVSGSRPSFVHAPRTQSVAAAAQGIPNRIFHHKLNPTQKDEPFLWNNVQLQLEPGHSYVAWCEGSIDLDPKDEVRQSLEQTYGAVFSDPHILQISPDSAKMSPAWVKKTWSSNWPMPNEPVGIPIAKVGDGLYMRLYSRPIKFTVPAKIWDSRFTISMNLPRSDYLRGDIDNHAVFVQGTHGFYTLFLREVAD